MEIVYDEKTECRIRQEFKRLDERCYLDHAGTTLYSETQMRNICEDLCSSVYGNPHSLSLNSKECTDIVEEVRNRILRHFHTTASKYSLIFTSGATASIQLLLQNFDWSCENDSDEEFYDADPVDHGSAYVYTQSNHTSVVGGRELALERGADFFCLPDAEAEELLSRDRHRRTGNLRLGNSLFAYPAQCNFSGRKYPLEWIERVQEGALDNVGERRRHSKWLVLLDAAAYCSTSDLDLSVWSPDFVCLSFYKIFGYPTGLGALLVRNASVHALRKCYFGGGTVEVSLSRCHFHRLRRVLHERFEDGTIAFLSVIALNHGLKTLDRLNLTMKLISRHVFNLASYAYKRMKALRHWNGEPLVEFYADTDYTDPSKQGGIVNFNLRRSDRRYIGFMEVMHIANLNNVQFRVGCFCNTGACQRHLGMTDRNVKSYFEAGHVCGDDRDLINGRPTGSIRISVGYMTTQDNIDHFVRMIRDSFLEVSPTSLSFMRDGSRVTDRALVLSKIWAYPIKSCGAMEVDSWALTEKGLAYDREWMIVTETGVCLTQKQQPKMCLVVPRLDLFTGTLTLMFRTSSETVTIPIDAEDSQRDGQYDVCESKVCGDRILGYDCGDGVGDWLSRHLDMPGLRLVRQSKDDGRKNNVSSGENGKLSLSNQAQYLLVNNDSVKWLQDRVEPGDDVNMDTFAYRFRGNFLVDGAGEFAEVKWSELSIGAVEFKVDGPCGRCQMICIDQYTGDKSRKPLVAISRAFNGKIKFGIYLSHVDLKSGSVISVGDKIRIRQYAEFNI